AASAAYNEITSIARRVGDGVVSGDYRGAVAAFVDYWNGYGTWHTMRPAIQKALIRWAPKGPLDFRALIDEPTSIEAYRALKFPILLLRGEHAPLPSRVIADGLASLLPDRRFVVVDGAGHMGPLTHAPEVSALIVRHIAEVEAAAKLQRGPSPLGNQENVDDRAKQKPRDPGTACGPARRWYEQRRRGADFSDHLLS